MGVLDPNDVINTACSMGWTYTRYDANQGQLVFLERVMRGELFKLHIWCTTGTVGSFLDHPKQGKTQLYRRHVVRAGRTRRRQLGANECLQFWTGVDFEQPSCPYG